ncbi:MAG: sugar transferase [Candidatus Eremiobacteraeota bacterium]|nr:sugar transferase [Candidatus Eremiobacteraeota bacterium]MCL5054617.1 sugar transferase [Bacillota bacterium]
MKRIFDLLGAVFLLILFSPLLLAASFAIVLESGFPVFFKQIRVGKGGKLFWLYKFRTLRQSSPPLHLDPKEINDLHQFVFPPPPEQELTKVGGFLRKIGVNELPQLVNVLKGEMSLVGPRPEVPEIVNLYSDSFKERLKVKPGITSLAYVSGGSALKLKDGIELDLQYIQNQSFYLDIKILLKTVYVAFSGRGY